MTLYNGSTIRLKASFYDWNNTLTDPTFVKLRIYEKETQLTEEIPLRDSLGSYYFDYVPITKNKKLMYEWYAEINGYPNIKRGYFTTVQVEEVIN